MRRSGAAAMVLRCSANLPIATSKGYEHDHHQHGHEWMCVRVCTRAHAGVRVHVRMPAHLHVHACVRAWVQGPISRWAIKFPASTFLPFKEICEARQRSKRSSDRSQFVLHRA